MPVTAAYIGVIIIWSTTPLAIQWSSEGAFLYALTMRMLIGGVTLGALMLLIGERFPWHRRAQMVYLISGLSIYFAMTLVYWSAQHIPSGWISVVFGLSPIFTGVLATLWLKENGLSPLKLLGMGLGLMGLVLIFGGGTHIGEMAIVGVLAMLLSTLVHAASSVAIKGLAYDLSGLSISAGGIAIATLLLALTGLQMDIDWSPDISPRAMGSICYLGFIGSAAGFTLYYYVLRRVSVIRVSLIALMTPVFALVLGNWLNEEPMLLSIWIGAALIGLGLVFFELNSENRKAVRLFLRTLGAREETSALE